MAGIKTLPQLHNALRDLVDDRYGSVRAEAAKHVVEKFELGRRSTSTFYCGEIRWRLPEQQGGRLYVFGTGRTPRQAYEECRLALIREIEERCRKRQLNFHAAALTVAEEKRLEAVVRQPLLLEYRPN